MFTFVTFTIIYPLCNISHFLASIESRLVLISRPHCICQYCCLEMHTRKWRKLITACVFAQCRWVCWWHTGIHTNSSSVALVPDPLRRRIHSLPAHSSCRHSHAVIQSLTLPPQHLRIYWNNHTKVHFPFSLSSDKCCLWIKMGPHCLW